MLTVGVALFATFSGFLANAFLSVKKGAPEPPASEQDLQTTFRNVERLHAEQASELERLRAQLADLEPGDKVGAGPQVTTAAALA